MEIGFKKAVFLNGEVLLKRLIVFLKWSFLGLKKSLFLWNLVETLYNNNNNNKTDLDELFCKWITCTALLLSRKRSLQKRNSSVVMKLMDSTAHNNRLQFSISQSQLKSLFNLNACSVPIVWIMFVHMYVSPCFHVLYFYGEVRFEKYLVLFFCLVFLFLITGFPVIKMNFISFVFF